MNSVFRYFKILPFAVATRVFLFYLARRILKIQAKISYSQFGEDINIDTLVNKNDNSKNGFYIDVGCNNPIKLSNTFNLYLKGWNGIVIDANKDLIQYYKKVRKNDIHVCSAVSNDFREIIFYKSKADAVSTIDKETYLERKGQWKYDDSDFEKFNTRTLTSILDESMPDRTKEIDLLCVDVEGQDYEVLMGLDFNKYKPKCIIVEIFSDSIDGVYKTNVYKLLDSLGYEMLWYYVHNAFFRIKNK